MISKKRVKKEGFRHIELKASLVLSYHKDLKVYCHRDPEVLLLGCAWQVKPGSDDPVREIEKLFHCQNRMASEKDILEMEESWCGRYVLIVEGKVYLDATGLLGIFYSNFGISSSTALLAETMGVEKQPFQPSSALNWLPGPLTQYQEIRRLLPSQVYDIRNLSISARRLLACNLPEFSGEAELIRIFCQHFSYSLKRMAKTVPGKLLIALTGGYDSRTLLALAKYANLDFACFTMVDDKTIKDDITIPRQLCESIGCEYYQIHRNSDNYSEERWKEYTEFTDNLADDGDKIHYSFGLYKELTDQLGAVTLLRGSVWEVAIEYAEKLFKDGLNGDMAFDYYKLDDKSLEADSLNAFFDWEKHNDQKEISPANLFFWEQRYGSWLSSIEQSFDLMDGICSVHPINSRWLISMLLCFPKAERVLKKHQMKIVAAIEPELLNIGFSNDIPINEGRLYHWKNRFKNAVALLSRRGIKKTFLYYTYLIKLKTKRHFGREY